MCVFFFNFWDEILDSSCIYFYLWINTSVELVLSSNQCLKALCYEARGQETPGSRVFTFLLSPAAIAPQCSGFSLKFGESSWAFMLATAFKKKKKFSQRKVLQLPFAPPPPLPFKVRFKVQVRSRILQLQ